MKYFKILISVIALTTFSTLNSFGEEINVLQDTSTINNDSVVVSQYEIETKLLDNLYVELLDIEKQIRLTHNTLVDLNFMSPGVERKIHQTLDGLNERLNHATTQLDSLKDKDIKAKSKPYKVTVKDCKQKLSKCSAMLKKKSK